jgi:hypothetical protein
MFIWNRKLQKASYREGEELVEKPSKGRTYPERCPKCLRKKVANSEG